MELILFRSMRLVLTLLLFRNVFGMVPDAPTEQEISSSSTGAQASTATLDPPTHQERGKEPQKSSVHEIEEEPSVSSSGITNDIPSTSGTVPENPEPFIKGIEEPFKETYEPLIMFENGEKIIPFQNPFSFAAQPKGIYRYYCPAEKEEDLNKNLTFCRHRQCLFLLKKTEEYDYSIKCKMHIVPITQPLRNSCGSQGVYRIGISVMLVLEEPKPLPAENPQSDTTVKDIVQSLSKTLYLSVNRGISSFSQWFSGEPGNLEEPLLDSQQPDVVEEKSASGSETDASPPRAVSEVDVPSANPISRNSTELETPLLDSRNKKETEIVEESTSDQNSYIAPSESQIMGELGEKEESLNPENENQPDPSTSDSQTDESKPTTQYKLLSVNLYQICIDETLQSYHSLHIVPYRLLPRTKLYASYISEKGMDLLRKDYFTQHNLKLSYHNHNQIFSSNATTKHKIVPQQLIPSKHQSSVLWEKATLFNINTAPLYMKFAELWNRIDELLDEATRKFKSEILVYTGVLDSKRIAKSAELESFTLMRTSIPLSVNENRTVISHAVPLAWYRIIGLLDSEKTLIIILINDYKKTKKSYKIIGCVSVEEEKNWGLVFNNIELLHDPNIVFCEYPVKIFSSKQEEGTFPKDILEDPLDLVLNILGEM